jgi:hypothetical protein
MNRAIAITAAILALVTGLDQAWLAIQLPELAATYSNATKGLEHYTLSLVHFVVWLRVEAALSAVAAVTLIFGAWMLLTRKPVGRTLVIAGCLVVIGHTGVGWVVAARMVYWFTEMGAAAESFRWFDTSSKLAIAPLSLGLPAITGTLLLHPNVRRLLDRLETAEAGH